jgi:hypothetical protein
MRFDEHTAPGTRFGSIINEIGRWGSSELINLSHAICEIVDRRGAVRQPSLKQIKEAVAAVSGIAVEDLSSERRDRDVKRPRKVAMALCKHLTLAGYPRIGRAFERQPGAAHRASQQMAPLIAYVGNTLPAGATVKDWAVNMLAAYEQVVGQD